MLKQGMKIGGRHLMPFSEVRQQVRVEDEGKWDEAVSRRDLVMRDGTLVVPSGGEEKHLLLSSWAEGQFASRLGIPVNYWRSMPPILKDQNANYWLKDGPAKREHDDERPKKSGDEKWLLRCSHSNVRAVLSESYSPLDNGSLCDNIAGLLSPRHKVNWFGLGDEESFHLHVVDPDLVRAVLPGDDYFCGVYIGNSEVGKRLVQCEAYLLRLVCTNGMVAMLDGKSLMRRRHIHIESSRFQSALCEAFSEALNCAEGFIETLRRTTTEPVPDPQLVLQRLGERLDLSETTQVAAFDAIKRESPRVQETCYGLVQGLTEAAQGLPDAARHDLEVLAGNLAQHGVPKWALRREEEHDWTAPKRRTSRAERMEVAL